MDLGRGQYIALRVIQLSSSFLSLVASSIMAAMVIGSEKGLSSPHRRIILGLSIADIIHKFGLFIGPFLIPQGTDGAYWAKGNEHSCSADGFLLHLGGTTVPMYFLFLSFYYMYKVRYQISDKDFCKTRERWLHFVITAANLILAVALVSSNNFNSDGNGGYCYIRPDPLYCDVHDSQQECSRGKHARTFGYGLFYFPTVACFIGILITMGMLYSTVSKQEKRNRQYTFRPGSMEGGHSSGVNSNSRTSEISSLFTTSEVTRADLMTSPASARHGTRTVRRHSALLPGRDHFSTLNNRPASDSMLPSRPRRRLSFQDLSSVDEGSTHEGGGGVGGGRARRRVSFADMRQTIRESLNMANLEEDQPPLAAYVSRRERKSKARRYETMKQAMYYVIVFFISYIWPLSYELAYDRYPFVASIFFYLIYPLGGFFNILVYTRQKVATVKNRHDYSWPRAFWEVVKAGGDVPSRTSLRRGSRTSRNVVRRGEGTNRLRGRRGRGETGRRRTRRRNSDTATIRRNSRLTSINSGTFRRNSRLANTNNTERLRHGSGLGPGSAQSLTPSRMHSYPISLPPQNDPSSSDDDIEALKAKRPPTSLPQSILDQLEYDSSNSSDEGIPLVPIPSVKPPTLTPASSTLPEYDPLSLHSGQDEEDKKMPADVDVPATSPSGFDSHSSDQGGGGPAMSMSVATLQVEMPSITSLRYDPVHTNERELGCCSDSPPPPHDDHDIEAPATSASQSQLDDHESLIGTSALLAAATIAKPGAYNHDIEAPSSISTLSATNVAESDPHHHHDMEEAQLTCSRSHSDEDDDDDHHHHRHESPSPSGTFPHDNIRGLAASQQQHSNANGLKESQTDTLPTLRSSDVTTHDHGNEHDIEAGTLPSYDQDPHELEHVHDHDDHHPNNSIGKGDEDYEIPSDIENFDVDIGSRSGSGSRSGNN